MLAAYFHNVNRSSEIALAHVRSAEFWNSTGLRPAPESRSRRAVLHLWRSFSHSSQSTHRQPPTALLQHTAPQLFASRQIELVSPYPRSATLGAIEYSCCNPSSGDLASTTTLFPSRWRDPSCLTLANDVGPVCGRVATRRICVRLSFQKRTLLTSRWYCPRGAGQRGPAHSNRFAGKSSKA
jgi:hypothetical protein